jgi:hypothetical protein
MRQRRAAHAPTDTPKREKRCLVEAYFHGEHRPCSIPSPTSKNSIVRKPDNVNKRKALVTAEPAENALRQLPTERHNTASPAWARTLLYALPTAAVRVPGPLLL